MRVAAVVILVFSMLMAPAAAGAATQVRFVHAVPGASEAVLSVDGDPAGSAVSYAEAGAYSDAPGGRVRLEVRPSGGGDAVAERSASLGPGRNTVVAWPRGERVQLSVYDDGRAEGGTARLRAIHTAGELGRAALRLDGRTLGALIPGQASSYKAVEPGAYTLRVTRTGDRGGAPLATRPGVQLVAGTSSTAFIVGSGGEPVRVITAADASAAPEEGPGTGLGGLEGGVPWLAALLAGLAAGALGGGAYLRAARGRGRAT